MRTFLGYVTAAVLFVLGLLVWNARPWGAAIGASCARAEDCAGSGSWCLMRRPPAYCSTTCRSDADCPSTWNCGPSGYNQVMYMNGEPMGDGTPIHVCRRPSDPGVASNDQPDR